MVTESSNSNSHWTVIFALVVAGEMVFSLPFHVARYFRPTVLDVFGLSNSALGDIFALYGITAMLSYFPGGALADRFSARKLLSFSLFATAAGGLFMTEIPDRAGMSVLYAYWGISSILLFWGALIRATREWGGVLAQGRAFGFLDGGRGLIAASVATLAVWVFSLALPSELISATENQRRQALQGVIWFYTLSTFGAGLLVWFVIPETQKPSRQFGDSFGRIRGVLFEPVIWLQSIIVICAYCGYKGLDNYALYGLQVLGMNEVESARFTSLAAYLRPVAAIAAGILADRFFANKVISTGFFCLSLGYTMLAFQSPANAPTQLILANLIMTIVAVFAIRGVYFALLEETNIDRNLTGTAVGLISLAGFTPDIFFTAVSGRLLDGAPGIAGHQHVFALLAITALAGMLATLFLAYRIRVRIEVGG